MAHSSRFLRSSHRSSALALDAVSGPVVDFDVVEKSSIASEEKSNCVCDDDEFWHWRGKKCIKKGGFGYECGFFPPEHQPYVCREGLTCEKLEGTSTKYFHEGAAPASCRPCSPGGACSQPKGSNCVKEYALSGEACVTIKATLVRNVTAAATAEHTAQANASAVAEATATHTVDGVEVTRTAEASHTATAEATAEAAAEVSSQRSGVAESRACVSLPEVKKNMSLSGVTKVGAVLAAKVIMTGDIMAYDAAMGQAAAQAERLGLLSAGEAAKQAAQAKAAEEAKMKAEEAAKEEAAWKAEAGAKEKAQVAAEAAAKAAAEGQTTVPPTTVPPTTVPPTTVGPAPAPAAAPTTLMPASPSPAPAVAEPPAPNATLAPEAPPLPPTGPPDFAEPVQPPADPQIPVPRKVTKEQVAEGLP